MPSVVRRPFHHCGPGNYVYDTPSENKIDEACRQHDIQYGKIGMKSYVMFNDADQIFIDAMDKVPESSSQYNRAQLYSNVFKIKKKVTFSSQKQTGMAKRSRSSRTRSRTPAPNTRQRTGLPTPRRTTNRRSRSRSATRVTRHRVGRAVPLRSARRYVRRAVRNAGGNRITARSANTHLKNGVTQVREVGDVKASPDCVYLGHSTYVPFQLQLGFFRAIVKNLLIKANKLNPRWDGLMLRGEDNDSIKVLYKGNAEKDTNLLEYIQPWNALTTTQEQIANALQQQFQDDNTQIQFVEFQYRPSSTNYGAISYYVDYGYIDLYVKSTLTLQNRTIDEPNDDSVLNIDRVPLIGKRYHGNGSGTKYITTPQIANASGEGATVPFGGDMQDGVIWIDPENVNRRTELIEQNTLYTLREPPPSKHFQGCKGAKVVSLEPGQMLTDTLYLKKTMKIQDFVNAVWTKPIVTTEDQDLMTDSNAFRQSSLGNWSFFGMEKKLAATLASSSNPVKLAYQVDTKSSLVIRPKRSTYTTPVISVGNIGPVTTGEE